MHFNKKREENTNTTGPGIFDEENFDMYRLIAIDTLNIDQYSRLTLTNKVKNVLNIEAQDKIAVYQNTYNPDELLFRIQRCGGLVDNWKLKRKRMGLAYNEKKSSAPSIVASILDGKGTDSGGSNALYGFHNKNEIRNIIPHPKSRHLIPGLIPASLSVSNVLSWKTSDCILSSLSSSFPDDPNTYLSS